MACNSTCCWSKLPSTPLIKLKMGVFMSGVTRTIQSQWMFQVLIVCMQTNYTHSQVFWLMGLFSHTIFNRISKTFIAVTATQATHMYVFDKIHALQYLTCVWNNRDWSDSLAWETFLTFCFVLVDWFTDYVRSSIILCGEPAIHIWTSTLKRKLSDSNLVVNNNRFIIKRKGVPTLVADC